MDEPASPPAIPAGDRQPDAADTPRKLTPKRRRLIERMVWHGERLPIAAASIGMSESAARIALRAPEVRAEMQAQMQVLKSSERPRNIRRLAELRDQDEAKGAAVQAARLLEEMAEDGTERRHQGVALGIVVVIPQGAGSEPQMGHLATIDAKPLIHRDDVPADAWGTDEEPADG